MDAMLDALTVVAAVSVAVRQSLLYVSQVFPRVACVAWDGGYPRYPPRDCGPIIIMGDIGSMGGKPFKPK